MIYYKHYLQSRSYAVQLPEHITLKQMLEDWICWAQPPSEFELSFGESKLHPDDIFNRKVGREQAASRMAPKSFKIDSLTLRDRYVTITLSSQDKYTVKMRMTLDPNDSYRLISVFGPDSSSLRMALEAWGTYD